MFSVLISLWVIFISWRYLVASTTCLKINLAYFSESLPSGLLFIYCYSEFPPPYYIIKLIYVIQPYVLSCMFQLSHTVLWYLGDLAHSVFLSIFLCFSTHPQLIRLFRIFLLLFCVLSSNQLHSSPKHGLLFQDPCKIECLWTISWIIFLLIFQDDIRFQYYPCWCLFSLIFRSFSCL